MRKSDKKPQSNFEETGFYVGAFPNWRYTGRYGLVKQTTLNQCQLPRPYGDTGLSVESVIFNLPFYMLGQLQESFRYFFENLSTPYGDKRSVTDDLLLLPYALVDFVPALFTATAAALAPVWVLVYLIANARGGSGGLVILLAPFIEMAVALFVVWEMLAVTLMITKAVVETGFALINILSIPLKGIVTGILALCDNNGEENNGILALSDNREDNDESQSLSL